MEITATGGAEPPLSRKRERLGIRATEGCLGCERVEYYGMFLTEAMIQIAIVASTLLIIHKVSRGFGGINVTTGNTADVNSLAVSRRR